MKVDPKAQPILEAGKKNPKPVYTLSVNEARKVMFQTLTNGRILDDVNEVENITVPSLHGLFAYTLQKYGRQKLV